MRDHGQRDRDPADPCDGADVVEPYVADDPASFHPPGTARSGSTETTSDSPGDGGPGTGRSGHAERVGGARTGIGTDAVVAPGDRANG